MILSVVAPHRRSILAWLVAVGLLTIMVSAVHAGPASTEFQINQLTTGDQQSPDLVATDDGGFLVVWQSPVTPGDDVNLAIIGRRLDSVGMPQNDDFQVNVSTTYGQRRPRIAKRADGSFVVVWETSYPGGKGALSALQARPFDAAGTGAEADFVVAVSPNIYTTINTHDVAAATRGEFVVVFSRFYYYDGSYSGSVVRRQFDNEGGLVDSATLSTESGREISVRASGDDSLGFVVTTHSREYFGQYNDTEARRFDPSGAPLGSAIAVHGDQPNGFGGGTSADAALAPGGDFVIVWNGYDTYSGYSTDIYGRRVDASDVLDPAGPVQLNAETSGLQQAARVARGVDGSFLVVWESFSAPGDDGLGLRGRWLTSTGNPSGAEFAVNSYTTGLQRRPELAASVDGRSFLVVWQSESGTGDVDGLSIRGRRFVLPSVFADGFESGDTMAWSGAQP